VAGGGTFNTQHLTLNAQPCGPCKWLGINGRWALLGFVGPLNFKIFLAAGTGGGHCHRKGSHAKGAADAKPRNGGQDGVTWAAGVSGVEKRSQNEAKLGRNFDVLKAGCIRKGLVFTEDYGAWRGLRPRLADGEKLQNEATVKVHDDTAKCCRRLMDNYHASWRVAQNPVDRMSTSTSGRMPDATMAAKDQEKPAEGFGFRSRTGGVGLK